MNPKSNSINETRHIRRLSGALSAACAVLIVCLPISVILYWAMAGETELAVRANLPSAGAVRSLQAWQRICGAVLTEIPIAVLAFGLWQARKCFRLFLSGRVFAVEAVSCLQRFAGCVLVSVVVGFFAGAGISAVLTLQNPPAMRHVALGFGSEQVFTVFFAGLVWLMAAVISQGQSLAEENATFV